MVVSSFGLSGLLLQSFVSPILPPMDQPGCRSVDPMWWVGRWEKMLRPVLFPCCGLAGWICSRLLTCYGYSVVVVMVVIVRFTACSLCWLLSVGHVGRLG
jgi:hypothetical protein